MLLAQAPLLGHAINICMSTEPNTCIEYTLVTERRDGVAHYTLIDTEKDVIIVTTSYKPLIDWVVKQGVRQIVPALPRHSTSKRRL